MELARAMPGEVAPCPGCKGQPLLVQQRGRDLYHCECPRCRVRLWDVPSAQDAVAAWEGLPRHTDESTEPRIAA